MNLNLWFDGWWVKLTHMATILGSYYSYTRYNTTREPTMVQVYMQHSYDQGQATPNYTNKPMKIDKILRNKTDLSYMYIYIASVRQFY